MFQFYKTATAMFTMFLLTETLEILLCDDKQYIQHLHDYKYVNFDSISNYSLTGYDGSNNQYTLVSLPEINHEFKVKPKRGLINAQKFYKKYNKFYF